MTVDKYHYSNEDPSTPLIFTVTGWSWDSCSRIGFQPEAGETVFARTEEANFADAHTNESDSTDSQAEEAYSVDELVEDAYTVDELVEDAYSVDEPVDKAYPTDNLAEESNLAVDDAYYMASNGAVLKVSAPGVLENDQSGSEKSLSIASCSQPAFAADFSINIDGSFTYTSSQDYCGVDSFTYRVTDGERESNEATVTIFIDCDQEDEEKISY